jgi:predicted DNA-binding ribbon-helix-helix protein
VYSINIDGRHTSVSREDGFWQALREIAMIRNLRMSELVSRIDEDRDNKNLSSAIRVFVLDHYRQVASNRHQLMAKQRREPGSPVTLGNIRQLGVCGLIMSCLNPRCRHEVIFSAEDLPDEIEVPSVAPGAVCSKCGERVELRPNWKEMSISPPTPGSIDWVMTNTKPAHR